MGQGAPAWAERRGRCVLLLVTVLPGECGGFGRGSTVPPSPVSTGLLLDHSQLHFQRRKKEELKELELL